MTRRQRIRRRKRLQSERRKIMGEKRWAEETRYNSMMNRKSGAKLLLAKPRRSRRQRSRAKWEWVKERMAWSA
jgi:hypothetical protein